MRWLLALSTVSLLLASSAAPADARQVRGVRIERTGPPLIEVDPGELASARFMVTATRGAVVTATAATPVTWRAVLATERLALDGGASRLVVAGVMVPTDATAGVYTVWYVARGEDGLVAASDSVEVRVREVRSIRAELSSVPGTVAAGESYSARFDLSNAGNARVPLVLDVQSSAGLVATADANRLVLEPGEVRSVPIRVATSGDVRHSFRHRLEVRAVSEWDEAVLASAVARVEVVPRSRPEPAPFHRFPVTMRVRASDPDGGRTPLELSGSGTLTERGGTRIDFLARGPERGRTILGDRDVYRLSVRSRSFAFQLGDQTYALTPLTERGRYGFGAGGALAAGRWTLAGFAHGDRHLALAGRQVGGSLGFRPATSADVSVQYLSTEGRGDLWSVRARVAPGRLAQVDAEYGAGGVGGGGAARSVELRGRHPLVDYGLRHTSSDVDYAGQSRGTEQNYAGVTVRPWRRLRWEAAYDRNETVLPSGGTIGSTDFVSHRTAVGYGNHLLLEYRSHTRRTDWGASPTHRDQESLRLRLGVPAGPLWFFPEAEAGAHRDRATGEAADFHRLAVQARVRGRSRSAYSARAEYHSGGSLSTGSAARASGAVEGSLRLGASTRLRLAGHATRHYREPTSTTSFFDLSLEQGLPGGATLAARTRKLASGILGMASRQETLHTIELALPIGVPVSRLRSSGQVEVRITDLESGLAVPDIPLRLGGRTVFTDRHGRAVISASPGSHVLEADRTTIGLDRITTLSLPLTVTVRAGHVEAVDIGLVRAASVSGSVRLLRFDETAGTAGSGPSPVIDGGGIRNLLLELRAGSEVQRRVSGASGSFRFDGLRPGRYTLRVVDGDLPRHHYLDVDSIELELAPGESLRTEFIVRPRHRPVRFIDGGELPASP